MNNINCHGRILLHGAMACVISLALSSSARAQESLRVRAPRRAVEGPIDRLAPPRFTSRASMDPNVAQGPGPGPIGPGPGCNLLPAPASIGATVSLSYFGPSPSASNASLVGPVQLLKSG